MEYLWLDFPCALVYEECAFLISLYCIEVCFFKRVKGSDDVRAYDYDKFIRIVSEEYILVIHKKSVFCVKHFY